MTTIDTRDMSREDWLAARTSGIGGSDAAAIVGLNPKKTPYQVYLEKRGEAEPEDLSDNERVYWGNELEEPIARRYALKMGVRVARVNQILRHPDLPYIIGNIDRRVVGQSRGLECKNVGYDVAHFGDQWGESGTDLVPPMYFIQVQHYYLVREFDAYDLAALIGGNDHRIYHIPADAATLDMMKQMYAAFWHCVQTGQPPAATTLHEAYMRFPRSMPDPIEANDTIAADVTALRELKASIKTLETECDSVQARIGTYMGEHDTLTRYYEPMLTWKSQTQRRLDGKALKADHPDLAASYEREIPMRVMRVAKEK